MTRQWNSRKAFTWSIHVLAWAIFFAFPFLMGYIFQSRRPPQASHSAENGIYYLIFFNNVFRCIVFYVHAHLLFPKLVYRKKYGGYALSLLGIVAALLVIDRLLFSVFIDSWTYSVPNFFVFNIPILLFILMASMAYRIARDRNSEMNRIKELENENLKTELALLRSQVSPHFMFNVLNNMVALARKKSDALEPSLIKLSQLLRYMLYETDEDKVLLENEISYLQSYIDLQKQRFGKHIRIDAQLEEVKQAYSIEPMLLIPFVENAFKHGTGLLEAGEIAIKLQVKDGTLLFTVKNRYSTDAAEPKDKTSGIGLANVKRRLDLLYRHNHTLHITTENGWFQVSLQLNLH